MCGLISVYIYTLKCGGDVKVKNAKETKVELVPFVAKHYDVLLNVFSFGVYPYFTANVVREANFRKGDSVLDLGSGTGRFACLIKKYIGEESKYVGIDLSEIMVQQAEKRCKDFKNTHFFSGRIEEELPLTEHFDEVFISFVLHGFTQENRIKIIKNAYKRLRAGGKFIILDYAEKDVETALPIVRFLIRRVECPLAEKFMQIDLKKLLSKIGFSDFNEKFHLKGYVRLEMCKKR